MALNLKTLNRRGGGNGGGETETVAVMVTKIVTVDQKKATPGEDYAEGFLLNDGLGMVAEFTPDGEPTTPVRFTKNFSEPKGQYVPLDVFDLNRRRGMHLAMEMGGTVILERAYLEQKSGMVKCGHLKVAVRNVAQGNEQCHSGLPVSVERERYTDDAGERRYSQNRFIANVPNARTFSSVDEFRAVVTTMLTPDENIGGNPGVYVRIIDTATMDVAMDRINLGWDREAQAQMSPEASLDRWMTDDKKKDWVAYLQSAGEAGYVFEAVPYIRYSTGKENLPSKKEKRPAVGFDHEHFQIDVVDSETGLPVARNDGEGNLQTNGYAIGMMMVRRAAADAPWFSTDTYRQKRNGATYLPAELITANLPKEVAAHFEEKAVARGEAKKAARAAAQNPGKDAQPGAQQDFGGEEIPFGEPDHGGGLTPS